MENSANFAIIWVLNQLASSFRVLTIGRRIMQPVTTGRGLADLTSPYKDRHGSTRFSILSFSPSSMFFPIAAVAVTFALNIVAQDPGQTVLFKTVLAADPGKCLSASGNYDGAPVVIGDCTPTGNNSWVVPQGAGVASALKVFGDKCLDVKDGANVNGAKLQVWTCAAGNTNQQFVTAGWDQTITWANKNKCLDVTDGKALNGQPIQIWDCDWENDNQRWNDPAVTQPDYFTLSWESNPSLCIGAQIQGINASVAILNCDPASLAQRFSDPLNNGQIRPWTGADADANLCVAPRANLVRDGTNLVTVPCDDKQAAQQWSRPSTRGYILNRGGNGFFECMDLTGGNASPGVPIQLWDCGELAGTGSNTNQNWVIHPTYL
ncbi:Carbohydrate-binding module family 13 protein [Mycena kentingensis (nom. inval.)]|nr:Carbohydrate-binding module family 13 protein [Mycena kentingensis (nom. inval.)]